MGAEREELSEGGGCEDVGGFCGGWGGEDVVLD